MLTMNTQFGAMTITDENQTLVDKKLADNITAASEVKPNMTVVKDGLVDNEKEK